MSDIRLNISDVDFAHDEETREARHELLASFLGAFVDNELPPETRSQIDAHLTGCARCRRELDVHRALRDRLGNEPVPAASTALRSRIAMGIKNAAPPTFAPEPSVDVQVTPRRNATTRIWIGVVTAAVLSLGALFLVAPWRAPRTSVVTAQSAPLFGAILADYRRVMAGNLPGRAGDLEAVRAAVPFTFAPLSSGSLRLLGAWTASIADEPAVVLEYRFNDRIILQYFVSDVLLFQSASVRASLIRSGSVSVTDGAEGMLSWAEPEYGTLLVGNIAPEKFAALRDASRKP
ncbi:MAG: anti-sigma factor [Gemmatimonas sp.]